MPIKKYLEDVTEVEVKPDGCWRPKHDDENKLLEDWIFPDGSINMKKSRYQESECNFETGEAGPLEKGKAKGCIIRRAYDIENWNQEK